MIRLITIFLLFCLSVNAAPLKPKLEIHRVYQKVNAAGRPYGAPGGIYFKYFNLDPFIMYGLEYSHDMKIWTHLYTFGTVGDNTTSPKFEWFELPPGKCFFRIVKLW